jgi:hypothetical protein
VTREELAERYPLLFHVTLGGTWPRIERHGLLSTSALLDLYGVSGSRRIALERSRRATRTPIYHPDLGTAILNDQQPMTEAALARCLDDGLSPADWLALLNRHVFFWTTEPMLTRFLGARGNRGRVLEVLVVDTLRLATQHANTIELCPINSGTTLRRAARRGLATFTPLTALSFDEWSSRRGGRDEVREVTVLDGIPDIGRHVSQVRCVIPRQVSGPTTSTSTNRS